MNLLSRFNHAILDNHEAEQPFLREEKVKGEWRRWWRCKDCKREFWLPAEH